MNLNLVNNLFNNLKENKFVQNFIKELSNHLENSKNINNDWNNLLSNDLTLYGHKITVKYRNEMQVERNKILQNYAKNTEKDGEMYYIYNTSTNENNSFNLCSCKEEKSHEVITEQIDKLPSGSKLGSVLRKQGESFRLDQTATKIVGEQINAMIKEKIEEQNKYLNIKRIDGQVYEAGEKYSGRIWLYDLNNVNGGGIEGVEEIEFPQDLYENAKEGDKFIYKDGKYQRYI